MKTYILPLVMFLLFMSCTEEEITPATVDPFLGTWAYSNTDIGMEMTFNVTATDGAYAFNNINIVYEDIQDAEYDLAVYEPFAVNTGFKKMELWASWTLSPCEGTMFCDKWMKITMDHNRIHLKEQDKLKVYGMEIRMINQEPIVLQDQVFTRSL